MGFRQLSLEDWFIIDLGATRYVLVTAAPVADIIPTINPFTVAIPDGSRVHSMHNFKSAILELLERVRIGHVVPGLASCLLVSGSNYAIQDVKSHSQKTIAPINIMTEWYS